MGFLVETAHVRFTRRSLCLAMIAVLREPIARRLENSECTFASLMGREVLARFPVIFAGMWAFAGAEGLP